MQTAAVLLVSQMERILIKHLINNKWPTAWTPMATETIFKKSLLAELVIYFMRLNNTHTQKKKSQSHINNNSSVQINIRKYSPESVRRNDKEPFSSDISYEVDHLTQFHNSVHIRRQAYPCTLLWATVLNLLEIVFHQTRTDLTKKWNKTIVLNTRH